MIVSGAFWHRDLQILVMAQIFATTIKMFSLVYQTTKCYLKFYKFFFCFPACQHVSGREAWPAYGWWSQAGEQLLTSWQAAGHLLPLFGPIQFLNICVCSCSRSYTWVGGGETGGEDMPWFKPACSVAVRYAAGLPPSLLSLGLLLLWPRLARSLLLD